MNYNFYKATKLFIIIENIAYLVPAGKFFSAVDISYKKMFFFDHKIIPIFFLIHAVWCARSMSSQKPQIQYVVLEVSTGFSFPNICFFVCRSALKI